MNWLNYSLCTVHFFSWQCGLNIIKKPKSCCWVFFEASSWQQCRPFLVSGAVDKIIGFVNNTDSHTVQEQAHGMPSIQRMRWDPKSKTVSHLKRNGTSIRALFAPNPNTQYAAPVTFLPMQGVRLQYWLSDGSPPALSKESACYSSEHAIKS